MQLETRLGTLALVVVLSSAVLVGCEGAPEPAVAGSSSGLLVDPPQLWEADSIEVCWVNPLSTVPNEAEAWLREAVEGSWEQAVKVDFTGWGYCGDLTPPNQPPRITVYLTPEGIIDDRPGARDFDFMYPQGLKQMQLTYYFNYYSSCDSDAGPVVGPSGRHFDSFREMCFKSVVLHEFGHALGFFHEQHYEVEDQPTPCTDESVHQPSGERFADHYDPVSVMNYCSPLVAAEFQDQMLTPWDLAGAQDRYGHPGNDFLWFSHGNINDVWYLDQNDDYLMFEWRKRPIAGAYKGVTGDFDGDGNDDIHWYRGTGVDTTWLSNGDRTFTDYYGQSEALTTDMGGNYQPVAGDFDGDGRDDIFFYNLSAGPEWVWFGSVGSEGGEDFLYFTLGATQNISATNYQVYSGDFDGDGRSDVFFYRAGSGSDYIWWGNANRTFTSSANLDIGGTYQPVIGKLNNDNRSDILFYRSGTASDIIWSGKSNRTFDHHNNSVIDQDGTGLKPVAGDFDNNGFDDVYWVATGANSDHVWLFDGTSSFSYSRVYVPMEGNFDYGLSGNFDGDAYDDLMMFNDN